MPIRTRMCISLDGYVTTADGWPAQLADPGWDYRAAFARYKAGFKLPLDATRSVRGSRTGELIARCMVETGTSSYYTALADASQEPVLQQICRLIAADAPTSLRPAPLRCRA